MGLFGRILGQLDLGLLWGSGLCLIAGVVFWSKTSQPRDRLHFSLTLKLFDLPLLIIIFGSTFLIALVAFKYAFHDEMNIQSHAPVIESMLRGEFPPSYIAFPEVSFKYHYGFDLLAAVFCLVTGLPGFLGIDGIALTSWISLLAILIVFLKSLGVPRQTWGIALAFIVLSGGWAWWLASGEPGGRGASFQVPQWQEMFLFGRFIHPQIISYFFQHPMGMGLPLFFGALVYFNDFFSEERRGSLLVGSLILGALSLTQVVLFVTLLASLGMVFLWKLASEEGKRKENFLNGLAILFLTVLLALGLGGFSQFSENYQGNALLFSWPPGYLRHEYWGSRFSLSFSQALIWYLSSFGVVLIIAPIAWFLTFRRKNPTLWVLACFGILGFLIPQFLRYQFSWDIIKWLF